MSLRGLRQTIGSRLYYKLGRANQHVQRSRSLPNDVFESDSSYQVVFESPGAQPDDVTVNYLDGALRVRISRYRQYYDGFETRFPGRSMKLEGDVDLPEDAVVEPEAAEATLTEHGTIRVELPKSEPVVAGEAQAEAEGEEIAIE